jgi:hypothetical protein
LANRFESGPDYPNGFAWRVGFGTFDKRMRSGSPQEKDGPSASHAAVISSHTPAEASTQLAVNRVLRLFRFLARISLAHRLTAVQTTNNLCPRNLFSHTAPMVPAGENLGRLHTPALWLTAESNVAYISTSITSPVFWCASNSTSSGAGPLSSLQSLLHDFNECGIAGNSKSTIGDTLDRASDR